MKLVQANIWFGRLTDPLESFLEKERPDILCLQEAVDFSGKKTGGLFLTLEDIKQIGGWTAFFSSIFTFDFMNENMTMGNAILSKETLFQAKTIFTHLKHRNKFSFDTDDYNIRNLQHAHIRLGNKKLHLLNHHGYRIPEHKNGNQETMRQMQQLADYIKELDGPVILTGDFNLAPHSESLEILNKVLKNLSVAHGLRTTRTYLTHKTEVCDYIFVNEDVKVNDFKASDEVVSDHRALILEFEI